MEVASAESKRTHRPSPGRIRAVHPGTPRRIQIERAVVDVEIGIRSIDLDRGRQDAVMQRHHDLEQRGHPRGGFGMPDLRFDRPERHLAPPISEGRTKNLTQAFELGRVARRGRRAVGLHQFDGIGTVASLLVRAPDRLALALGAGRVDALGAAVGRGAQTADDAVDFVAVAFGIGKTPQRDHPDPFAQHRTVRRRRKRPAIARFRQRRGLAEAHEHKGVVQCVTSPRNHQVRVPELKLLHPHRDRGEAAGACGIDDTVGASEIQPVGDAAGYDVTEQAGKGIFGPLGVRIGDAPSHVLDLILRQTALAQCLHPVRFLDSRRHLPDQLRCRGDTEDRAHARAIHLLKLQADRIIQNLLGYDQCQELHGIRGRERGRWQSEFHRIERDLRQKGAALRIDFFRRRGVGIEIVFEEPVVGWHVLDEVLALQYVVPELLRPSGPRKEHAHAHDRNRREGRRHRVVRWRHVVSQEDRAGQACR